MNQSKGYQIFAYAMIVLVALVGYNRLQQQKTDSEIKNNQLKASVDALASQVRSLGGVPIAGTPNPNIVYTGPHVLSIVGPSGPAGGKGLDGKDGSDGQNGSDVVKVVVVYATPSLEPKPSPEPSPKPSLSSRPSPSPSPSETPSPTPSSSETPTPTPSSSESSQVSVFIGPVYLMRVPHTTKLAHIKRF